MAATPPENESSESKALSTVYSDYLWKRLSSFFPFSGSNFLGKLSNLYRQLTRARSRRRGPCLPLPLPSTSLDSIVETSEASRVFDVLQDILEHICLDLHNIQKNLHFWQSRAEASNAQKVYFLLFERGPRAFIHGTIRLVRECVVEGSGMKNLSRSASAHISERITVLTTLRYHLATFLAQVYVEVDRFSEDLVRDPQKSLPELLVTINGLFSKLEASISHFHAVHQCDSSVDGSYSFPLMFEKLPEVNQEGSQWTDCESRDAINLIYENLHKLDSYLADLVAKHQKPRKVTLYWTRYTIGFVGVSVCSFWLLKHSRLMGSSDIDNWIHEAKESTISFWKDHVEQPLLAIRDELFETFRKRHKGVMEQEEVQLTANSLHRMLQAFSEQTTGQKYPENASEQKMLEVVMSRYEKEVMNPIKNLVGGELARALLIQIQKLKLDIETAMLELDQILRANEINFAILAALPAFFLSFLLLMLMRAWLKKDTRAEGRGRIARLQRRLLIVEVEKRIMQFQICIDQGLENDAEYMYGLGLYSLDRLYRAVERHAKATGEWQCLRQDIIDLAKPRLRTEYKFTITSRMVQVYDCLLPSSTRR
ncbi:protein DGS1, mitochondrial [Rhododendron vialii]|uniref:protein DGS1, mitochondrial n=1 Tax=Rhododendron vialii TaxID=182163 RepID=UPI00265E5C9E|nr:protein DGS1, mitochondrial [Rhododendron vialii]